LDFAARDTSLMPRRVKKQTSIFAPASNFIKRLSDTDVRLRRKVLRLGLWAMAAVFLYSFMSGTYGIPRIIRLELEKRALIKANKSLTVELIDADRIRQMLKNDPNFIEYIARTKYHMAYPDETIFRYRGQ
jgi:cell division protein FtsB